MAERIHPDSPDFQDRWVFRLRRGWLPWIAYTRSPYRKAFLWRYGWVSDQAKGLDVLDVPCGMGWGTSLIQGARSIVGVDIDIASIHEATLRHGGHATFLVGNMSKLEFPDDSFDLVSCLEGIEHVPSEVAPCFIDESARVLRPNGLLLLSSPYCRSGNHSGNPYHLREYRPEELKAMLQRKFSMESVISKDVDILTVLYVTCRKK
jgi:2-polyprenyl-3-methyl-5-hydroxy-6-metoxy-1,4-benzoquinol methylase